MNKLTQFSYHLTVAPLLLGAFIGGTFGVLSSPAMAAEFPSRPVTLLIGYPPGGGADLMGRMVSAVATPHLGQPLIATQRIGGAGAVAAHTIVTSQPDGYSMILGDAILNSLRPLVENMPFKAEDMKPVCRLNYAASVIVTRVDAPFDTLKGLIDFAKANPEKFSYSHITHGPEWMVFSQLGAKTGIRFTGIPFGGGGPAAQALLSGSVMAYAGPVLVSFPYIESKKFRALAVADEKRLPSLPDVPTTAELGYPDVQFRLWQGLLVHKDTPDDVMKVLRGACAGIVKDPSFVSLSARVGQDIHYMDGPEFDRELEKERKMFKKTFDELKK
jgi:tripartite-type tricarboxylate transporter receptor subunit TctC